MRRRRHQDTWDLLLDLPWWLSIILFALTYLACRFLVPQIQLASPLFVPLVQAVSTYAHFFAAPFLLTAFLSLVNEISRDRR